MFTLMFYVITSLSGISGKIGLFSEGFISSQSPFAVFEGKMLFEYEFDPDLWAFFEGSIFRTFEKDSFSYYRDPFSRPEFYPYSFDPQPVITRYRLFEVRFLRGFISFKRSNLEIKMGRDTIRWPSSLFISNCVYPFDFLYRARYKKGPILLDVFNAALPDTFELKRIAAQLIVVEPVTDFKVFLAEGVIYTRHNLLKYINPVAPYYVIQRRSDDGPENLMGILGIEYKGVRFFFLNDDFIIDKGGTSKYGTEFGLKYKNLDFTYVRIPRYTYTHYTDTNSWSINGVPIGYKYGPDVSDFYLKANFKHFNISLSYLNHGEGVMSEHWLHSGMPKNPPVPSGIVEEIIGIDIRKTFGEERELGVFFYKMNNYKNIPGLEERRIGFYYKLKFIKKIF